MPEMYYKDAQKLAQKEVKMCMARGQDPYLPVLDEILPRDKRNNKGQELGLLQIPAEFIVGTKTAGRTNAFARNFMPLLQESSEFADKWKRLCQAHLEEGIRDPIKVYEYMNRYYVQEGNKRVSVLRFFDAVTIAAQVTRILPERTEDLKTKLYFEYVEFNRISKVNFIEFTKLGSYAAFQKYVGKAPKELWSEEERGRLTTVYYYFKRAYDARGGKELTTTVGDALLAYIKVYGYHSLQDKTAGEIRATVSRAWEEITLQQDPTPIDVKLDPSATKKPDLLTKALLVAERSKPRRVAFIHDKRPEHSGWTYGHELGREQVQRVLDGKIVTTAYFREPDKEAHQLIEQAIADGNTILFTTSPVLLPASLRAAVEHPDVSVFNCSLNKSHRYVRSYYARMYEVKFVIGAIAGALAGNNNDVGYICDYPIFGQIAGINAFALGVEMVNPRARVYLEWSGIDSVEAATKRLTDRGIRLISSQDLARLEAQGRSSFGLSLVNEDGSQVNLARPVWNWGVYYEEMIRRMLDKSMQWEYEGSSKALNYYWGMSAGVVGLHHANTLPDGVHKLARVLQKSIRQGVCEPFRGPIYAQGGHPVRRAHETLSLEQIINMDWLVENVMGTIPAYEQLTSAGKATVDMMGVSPAMEKTAE